MIVIKAISPDKKKFKNLILFLIKKYIKSNSILIIKYKKRYFAKKPKPKKRPKIIKSNGLSYLIHRQVK